MTQEKAQQLANLIGGESFNSGGDVYIAYFIRPDGKVVAFTDEIVALYETVDGIGSDPIETVTLID